MKTPSTSTTPASAGSTACAVRLRRTALGAGLLAVGLGLGGCGGGGGGNAEAVSATAQPVTTNDLSDPKVALKIASVFTRYIDGRDALRFAKSDVFTSAGSPRCTTTTFSNTSGRLSAGETGTYRYQDCPESVPEGTLTFSGDRTETLSSFTGDPDVQTAGAWTAVVDAVLSGQSRWNVTVAEFTFEGSATLQGRSRISFDNQADDSQSVVVEFHVDARGTENGAPFEYVVDVRQICRVAAPIGTRVGPCTDTRGTLTGRFGSAAPTTATLSQPSSQPAVFTIDMANKQATVTQRPTSLTVTSADGRRIDISMGGVWALGVP